MKHEIWNCSQVIYCQRTLKRTYRLYWWCINCWFRISMKKIKHGIWSTEANLPSVLMIRELLIYNIKGNEVWDLNLFTSYVLTANVEVNLPTVLMMCELLIHNIIKKRSMSNKEFCNLSFNRDTENILPPVLMMCELFIHNFINENEEWE